jgi:hypothetical protein
VFTLELASALIYTPDSHQRQILSDNLDSAASYCFAFRGVWALVMILGPNWEDLTRSNLFLVDSSGASLKNVEDTVKVRRHYFETSLTRDYELPFVNGSLPYRKTC